MNTLREEFITNLISKSKEADVNIREKDASQIEALLQDKIPDEYSHIAVTSVSIVPSMRDEEDKDRFVQGIESLLILWQGKI